MTEKHKQNALKLIESGDATNRKLGIAIVAEAEFENLPQNCIVEGREYYYHVIDELRHNPTTFFSNRLIHEWHNIFKKLTPLMPHWFIDFGKAFMECIRSHRVPNIVVMSFESDMEIKEHSYEMGYLWPLYYDFNQNIIVINGIKIETAIRKTTEEKFKFYQ